MISIEALAEKLDTKIKEPGFADFYGLTEQEAARRLQADGPN